MKSGMELNIRNNLLMKSSNKIFYVESSLCAELKPDQSVSHNGVCLTVEEVKGNTHRVSAIEETLLKTNLNNWLMHDTINLQRCLPMNGRIDGHIVQGHVDTVAECTHKIKKEGSTEFSFEIDKKYAGHIIEKGSICLNGISLTIYNIGLTHFSAAIIPYTFEHTNMQQIKTGSLVNIEFDLLGKYIQRLQSIS